MPSHSRGHIGHFRYVTCPWQQAQKNEKNIDNFGGRKKRAERDADAHVHIIMYRRLTENDARVVIIIEKCIQMSLHFRLRFRIMLSIVPPNVTHAVRDVCAMVMRVCQVWSEWRRRKYYFAVFSHQEETTLKWRTTDRRKIVPAKFVYEIRWLASSVNTRTHTCERSRKKTERNGTKQNGKEENKTQMNANVLECMTLAMEERAIVGVNGAHRRCLRCLLWLLIYVLIYLQFSTVRRAQNAK